MLKVDRCYSVSVGGMRVPADHVLVELSVPGGYESAGEGRAVLTAVEEEILERGVRRANGTVVLRLDIASRGQGLDTRVSLAELKRLTNLSVKASVFGDSLAWMDRSVLERVSDPGYKQAPLLVDALPFDAKKARGASGRRQNAIHPAWEAAKENPDAAVTLLDGISPGTSQDADKSGGIGRANARQLAWLLTSEAVARELREVLDHAERYEYAAQILRQIREQGHDAYVNEMRAYDPIEYDEQLHETYDSAKDSLDVVLRFVRGMADLAKHDPDALAQFTAIHPNIFGRLFATSDRDRYTGQATPIEQALTMGYISVEQCALLQKARTHVQRQETGPGARGAVSAEPVLPERFFSEQLPVILSLGLRPGRAAVSGSLVFVGVPGISPDDIDVLCDQDTWHEYSTHPDATWRTTNSGVRTFSINGAEFFTDLPGMLSWSAPGIAEALASTEIRWGAPFLSVACMRGWKLRAGRDKDRAHVALVDRYLSSGGRTPGL